MKKIYVLVSCAIISLLLVGIVSAAMTQPEFLRRSPTDTSCIYLIQPDSFKLGVATTTCGDNKLYVSGTTTIAGLLTANSLTVSGTSTLASTTISYLIVSSLTSLSGNLDMNNNLIVNIGNAETDFVNGGGLTLAGVLTVNATSTFSNNVGIATTTPTSTLQVQGNAVVGDYGGGNYCLVSSVGALTYYGTGRPIRYIDLGVNNGVIWADGTNNAMTGYVDHDNTNHRNYTYATTTTAHQDIDFVWEFMIPDDFSAWTASNSLGFDVYATNASATGTVTMIDGSGNVDAGINEAAITIAAASTWATINDQPTATYTAGDWVHMHIKVSIPSVGCLFGIARVSFSYLAKN